jgi:deoxyribonuclease V
VPGLLSFREAPAVLAALRRLRTVPDALICDGQGLAHPRRFGLACHVGLIADLPAVGCGKSRLCGEHREPGRRRGSRARLVHDGEVVGTVLRTRVGVKPVYVSVGHRIDLPAAERLVLDCAVRFRLPEPTRLADALVGAAKRA